MTAAHWAKKAKSGKALKPRDPYDFYPTSPEHVRLGLARYAELNPAWVLDVGQGAGVWGIEGRQLWKTAEIVGIEIRYDAPAVAAYSWNIRADFLKMGGVTPMFDFIMANPPYALSEKIIRRCFDLLLPGSPMVMLFRLQFLASRRRFKFWREEFPPVEVMVCSDRPSFSGDGKTDSDDYMLVHWVKGYQGKTEITWGIADETEQIKASQQRLF